MKQFFLQCDILERHIWLRMEETFKLTHSIKLLHLLNFPSRFSKRLIELCVKSLLFSFTDLLESPKYFFPQLSNAEFYWLLQNSQLVDPSGGWLRMRAIDLYVYCNIYLPLTNQGDLTKTEIKKETRRYLARFMFALLESLEDQVSSDAPSGYNRRTNTPYNPGSGSHQNIEEPNQEFSSALDSRLEFTKMDMACVMKWRQDHNAFKIFFISHVGCAWKPCVVGSQKVR